MKRRYIALLLAVCLLASLVPLPTRAAPGWMHSGNLTMAAPTKDQIRAQWKKVTDAQTIFEEAPSVTDSYAAGKLSEELLRSGITYLNYIRYVAHLPQLQLSEELNRSAQHGAVVLAANNVLTYSPTKPQNMPQEFFDEGKAAVASSNIYSSSSQDLAGSLNAAVKGFVCDDVGLSNLQAVGHRRWILNPTLLNVGFGMAQSEQGYYYVPLKVFDRSGIAFDHDFVSWPASGNFPTNLFSANVPWSVSLNPSLYRKPIRENLKITVTRAHDGTVWTFDNTTGDPISSRFAYLSVETSNYGEGPCIIFHPGSSNVGAYMGLYSVEISGIFTKAGEPATLSYQVDFFDLDGKEDPDGHVYDREVTNPTCTEGGYTTFTCKLCGHSYTGEETEALGHDFQVLYEIPATATAPGLRYSSCSRCDEDLSESLPPLCEHNYDSRVIGPTCIAPGHTVHTCSKCGYVYLDQEVPALGHESVPFETIEPSCLVGGLTGGTYCSRCELPLEQRQATDPLGHDYTDTVTPPTCGDMGYTSHTCSRCGFSFADTHIPATGDHKYDNDQDLECNVCSYRRQAEEETIATVPMHRLYNLNSGEHFYTGSEDERDVLVEAGWQYEGIAWNAPRDEGTAVYRLYNPNSGDHHYTMSALERNILVDVGWQYEGIAWNSASPDRQPLYRLYNPNADCGSHHYTGSQEEVENLVSLGWIYEGIGWFGIP